MRFYEAYFTPLSCVSCVSSISSVAVATLTSCMKLHNSKSDRCIELNEIYSCSQRYKNAVTVSLHHSPTLLSALCFLDRLKRCEHPIIVADCSEQIITDEPSFFFSFFFFFSRVCLHYKITLSSEITLMSQTNDQLSLLCGHRNYKSLRDVYISLFYVPYTLETDITGCKNRTSTARSDQMQLCTFFKSCYVALIASRCSTPEVCVTCVRMKLKSRSGALREP